MRVDGKSRGHRGRSGGRMKQESTSRDGGRSGGRGRSSGRLFNQGDLRLIALRLIADKPRHGYELIKAIETTSSGVYRPSAGVIYPTLGYLEDMGFVTVSEDAETRKVHEITAEGRAYLQASSPLLDAIDARLGGIRKFSDDERNQPVRQAMDSLKASLRARLSSTELQQKDIDDIAAFIEKAAADIRQV